MRWISFHIFVEQDGAVRINNADKHFSCMKVDPGIELMVLFVKSH